MTTTTDTRPDTPALHAVDTSAREVATVDRAELDAPTKGALALRGDQSEWTEDQYAALVQLGIENAGAANLKVFLHVAQRTGLDPFSRQIYMIGRWDGAAKRTKWTIQTGIDGFRIIADRRPEYKGQTKPEWCGDDGVWRDVWLSSKPPVAARVGVYRSDFKEPIYVVCLFREFAQYRNGNLTNMWATKSAHMLQKCAEAGALRKAFPNDLGGIYTEDEMPGEGITFEGDHDNNDEGGVTADDLTGGVVDGEIVEDTAAAPATPTAGTSSADTGGVEELPELSEDEAIAFAQYCDELPGVTTEPQVRRAWAEAHASNWLTRPVPGSGKRVGDVLTAVIRELKKQQQEEQKKEESR